MGISFLRTMGRANGEGVMRSTRREAGKNGGMSGIGVPAGGLSDAMASVLDDVYAMEEVRYR